MCWGDGVNEREKLQEVVYSILAEGGKDPVLVMIATTTCLQQLNDEVCRSLLQSQSNGSSRRGVRALTHPAAAWIPECRCEESGRNNGLRIRAEGNGCQKKTDLTVSLQRFKEIWPWSGVSSKKVRFRKMDDKKVTFSTTKNLPRIKCYNFFSTRDRAKI